MHLNQSTLLLKAFLLLLIFEGVAQSQSPDAFSEPVADLIAISNVQRAAAMRFHAMAQQGCGLLIPLYKYPANIHTNVEFNRVMELKRKFCTIPFWVILNPGSGPGQAVDANYTKAIDRLQGAGCVVLGYVSTQYGKRDQNLVVTDLERWKRFYPRIQGLFFDEMVYNDDESSLEHQLDLSQSADEKGFWPIVTNPGASTPGRYFKTPVADVIIVHESDKWPDVESIHGNYFGSYSDYPAHSRGILIHSLKQLDAKQVELISRYCKWFYVTHDEYRINDPSASNPWDELSQHIEPTCKIILESQYSPQE